MSRPAVEAAGQCPTTTGRELVMARTKTRLAGALTVSVVMALALAPEAFARIALNHNETLLSS